MRPNDEASHVQLYDVARTAHFERILGEERPPIILYSERRYDFDADLAERVGARRAGVFGAFWYLLRHDVAVLEIAEPLVLRATPRSIAAILGARLRGLFRVRARARVVAYAIENKDPRPGVATLPTRARIKLRAQGLGAPWVWRRLDRIAYGTSQAAELYRRAFRPGRAQERLIPALPVAAIAPRQGVARPPTVVFLGEFSDRKGFPQLLGAWDDIFHERPDARLILIGKGEGVERARALGAADNRVDVHVDPPRASIFAMLAEAKVLVLPSQPRPRWREQVGLPIVEGLAHGCEIVTTSETGLAAWLSEHGHRVVDDPASVAALAAATVAALDSTRTPAQVLADLPVRDARADADAWLCASPVAEAAS